MSKLPRIKGQDALRAFEKAGFICSRVRGSHHRLSKDGCPSFTLPVHAGKDIKSGTLRAVIRSAGLTVEQFYKFLNE